MRLNGVVHKLESVTKGLNFFVIIWVKMVGGKNAEGERRGMGESPYAYKTSSWKIRIILKIEKRIMYVINNHTMQ